MPTKAADVTTNQVELAARQLARALREAQPHAAEIQTGLTDGQVSRLRDTRSTLIASLDALDRIIRAWESVNPSLFLEECPCLAGEPDRCAQHFPNGYHPRLVPIIGTARA